MRHGVPWAAAILSSLALAQGARDSWKMPGIDLNAHLTGTLADAKLSDSQRASIYSAFYTDKNIRDSFANPQDAQKAIMATTRVGSLSVSTDGDAQILTVGPEICNGAANRCIRLFALEKGRPRQILQTSGVSMVILQESVGGYHSLSVPSHLSAWEGVYREFRWDGSSDRPSDCYVVKYDRNDDPSNPKAPPAIADCT